MQFLFGSLRVKSMENYFCRTTFDPWLYIYSPPDTALMNQVWACTPELTVLPTIKEAELKVKRGTDDIFKVNFFLFAQIIPCDPSKVIPVWGQNTLFWMISPYGRQKLQSQLIKAWGELKNMTTPILWKQVTVT